MPRATTARGKMKEQRWMLAEHRQLLFGGLLWWNLRQKLRSCGGSLTDPQKVVVSGSNLATRAHIWDMQASFRRGESVRTQERDAPEVVIAEPCGSVTTRDLQATRLLFGESRRYGWVTALIGDDWHGWPVQQGLRDWSCVERQH